MYVQLGSITVAIYRRSHYHKPAESVQAPLKTAQLTNRLEAVTPNTKCFGSYF